MKPMRRFLSLLIAMLLLTGCAPNRDVPQVVATTLPVYEFTSILCKNTDIAVHRLITEDVSCLHNYSLQVRQLCALESAQVVIMTGAGFESFVLDVVHEDTDLILATAQTQHSHNHHQDHHHGEDPHTWLMPLEAKEMCHRIYEGLCVRYPQHTEALTENLASLEELLDDLQAYGDEQLQSLSCRQLITFHDGFSYLAESFGLEVLCAIEEESGSEASAAQLKELTVLIEENEIPAIFTEKNGSTSAAQIIARETGVGIYSLDMALSGDSYFDAMYHNIDTLKEALE